MLDPEDDKTGYTTDYVDVCPVCGGKLEDGRWERIADEIRHVYTCDKCGTEVSDVYTSSCTYIEDSRFMRTMSDEQLRCELLDMARKTGQPDETANLDDYCEVTDWLKGVMDAMPELRDDAERLADEIARL